MKNIKYYGTVKSICYVLVFCVNLTVNIQGNELFGKEDSSFLRREQCKQLNSCEIVEIVMNISFLFCGEVREK